MDARLSDKYCAVAGKILSAVDCSSSRVSNQHEITVIKGLKKILGEEPEKLILTCRYLRLDADGNRVVVVSEQYNQASYYDARAANPTRTEHRLYYPAGIEAVSLAEEGDYAWFLLEENKSLTFVTSPSDSDVSTALDKIFSTNLTHIKDDGHRSMKMGDVSTSQEVDIFDTEILELLGISVSLDDENVLSAMIEKFGSSLPFPSTKQFAQFTREYLSAREGISAHDDPDKVVKAWYEFSTEAFFAYEKYLLSPILKEKLVLPNGDVDVDEFFVQATKFKNGRFSRAGATFESHISEVLRGHGVYWVKPPKMSDGTKPDFIFPTKRLWEDADIDESLLTYLGAKTTLKERWRQVFNEGRRKTHKHLMTMDTSISEDALSEMATLPITLVLPEEILRTYDNPLDLMINFKSFISDLKLKEENIKSSGIPLVLDSDGTYLRGPL